MQPVRLPDATLEASVRGSGEPVVFIQTALLADELVPIADRPELRDNYSTVVYHRRGYEGSSAVKGPGSIARDADDCVRLLAELGIERAHVIGLSYSGAIALQVAADSPECVRTVCVIEPPPVHVPSAPEFVAANEQFIEDHRRLGSAEALDRFLTRVIGPDWRRDAEQHLPGSGASIERDANTFFATDLPALLTWRFSREDARRIIQPVLYVGGTASGPWFAEVHDLILDWLPHAEDVLIPGADHSLATTHAPQVAQVIATFLQRHRLKA
jgi:pimeloyl-ACP methyl ester carboxylesterase